MNLTLPFLQIHAFLASANELERTGVGVGDSVSSLSCLRSRNSIRVRIA